MFKLLLIFYIVYSKGFFVDKRYVIMNVFIIFNVLNFEFINNRFKKILIYFVLYIKFIYVICIIFNEEMVL